MSDEDRDIDVESDDDDDERTASSLLQSRSTEYMTQAEKRAHHNALERKRRDHIKDSFHNLRDAVPSLQGEKASRAHILKSATEYIQYMTKKNAAVHSNIEDLKKENRGLENQAVRALDRAKAAGLYAQSSQPVGSLEDALGSLDHPDDDSPAEDDEEQVIDSDYHIGSTRKKLKT